MQRFLFIGLLCASTTAALAQQAPAPSADQLNSIVPHLVEQRNSALNAMASCQGGADQLSAKLTAVEAELAKVKDELAKAKPAPVTPPSKP